MKHDEFVRYVMSDPLVFTSFFRQFMGDLERYLDFSELRMASESFVTALLRKTMTDLLFQAPWREQRDVYVNLLFEHKSRGSARYGPSSMVFQLRCQEMALLQRCAQQFPNRKLPIVLLVGLYHGAQAYSGPRTVAEIMEGPVELIPGRWRTEDVIMVDLANLDTSTLGEGKLALFLGVLKIVYDPDFVTKFRELLPLAQRLDRQWENRDFLIGLNNYLLSNAHWESLPEFREIAVKSYSEEVGGAVMTIAELLRRDGMEKAEERGIEKGIARVAVNLVRKGCDMETIAACTGLSPQEISMLANKAS